MKKILVSLAGIFLFAACNNKPAETSSGITGEDTVTTETASQTSVIDTANAPVMTFENTTYEFATISTGQKVSYSFKFRNTGKTPLIISNAQATCGCTVPDYPRAPVAPGEEGSINVVYDSAGQTGMQNKVVTLTSNANPATTQLFLTGKVL